MEEHRVSVWVGLVQHEVDALSEFNIGREQILAKWWEFANIDPAKTGYNTSSQSKALDSPWKALGFEDSKKPEEEEPNPEPPNFYKAAWLVERERGIFPETKENPEPALSSPEPPPAPELTRIDRGAELAQSSTASASGYGTNRTIEPTAPSQLLPRGSFGRFQRL